MLLSEPQEPRRKSRRREKSLPPAPSLRCTPFQAAFLLDELPKDLAAPLWSVARDAALWAEVEPYQREGLFSGRSPSTLDDLAARWPELAAAADVFAGLLREPAAIHADALSTACAAVGEWARNLDYPETAVHFAEVAALADALNPSLATAAARANREVAAYGRAARWLDRAIAVARRQRDQAGMAEAFLTWGNMAFRLAEYGRARRLFQRAERKGQRYNLRQMAGAARHNLLALEFSQKNYEAANEHALAAFALYGRDNPRLPYLAHDVAHLWATQGYYSLALRLLKASAPRITATGETVKVWANLGRAAAGVGDAEQFFEAWGRVSEEARVSDSPHASEALLAIADGALLLGRATLAAEVAQQALQSSIRRRHADVVRMAREALEAVRTGQKPPPETRPPDRVVALANRIIGALNG